MDDSKRGTEVQALTSADALVYAGLDWEVIQKDVYTKNSSPISRDRENVGLAWHPEKVSYCPESYSIAVCRWPEFGFSA